MASTHRSIKSKRTFILLVVVFKLLDILGSIGIISVESGIIFHCGKNVSNREFTIGGSLREIGWNFNNYFFNNVSLGFVTRLTEPGLARELQQTVIVIHNVIFNKVGLAFGRMTATQKRGKRNVRIIQRLNRGSRQLPFPLFWLFLLFFLLFLTLPAKLDKRTILFKWIVRLGNKRRVRQLRERNMRLPALLALTTTPFLLVFTRRTAAFLLFRKRLRLGAWLLWRRLFGALAQLSAVIVGRGCGRSNLLELLRHGYITMKRHGCRAEKKTPWLVNN